MSFAVLALATLLAFGSLLGFESMLANVDARRTALTLEIASQTQALERDRNVEDLGASIQSRIADLHLADAPRRQIAVLFGDIEAIARRRNVQITAFRHEGNARFEVTVDGQYAATLAALADLAGAHVAAQASRATFERAKDHVRAAFSLDVISLQSENDRPHIP